MARLHLLPDGVEVARRRARVARDRVVEAWPDRYATGAVWCGDESKALLDAVGGPLEAELTLPAEAVRVWYGPRIGELDTLPAEESLRARVLAAHGIAVAWATLDRSGRPRAHTPASPDDPLFRLHRAGRPGDHLWRIFLTRDEARAWMAEHDGADSEALAWAEALPCADFHTLLARHRSC